MTDSPAALTDEDNGAWLMQKTPRRVRRSGFRNDLGRANRAAVIEGMGNRKLSA